MERNPDNEAVPGALVVRVEAALLYFNVEHVREAVREKIRSSAGPLKLVAFDLSSSPTVDLAGARMLGALQAELQGFGLALRLVGARATVRDILRAEGLEERVGHIDRALSLADVIAEFHGNPRMD